MSNYRLTSLTCKKKNIINTNNTMAIQNEMYKDIVREIDVELENDKAPIIDVDKTKSVAKMLTDLSIDPSDAESLTQQYIASIRNICKS